MNPHFPINTLKIMRGAVAAGRENVFAPYVEAVFSAIWERGLKMDDPAVIAQALATVGLEADAILSRSDDPEVKQALIANTEAAVEAGAFGSPTFNLGGELYFGKDRLRDVEEALAAAR